VGDVSEVQGAEQALLPTSEVASYSMETPLALFVVTSDRRLLARIESLTRGSHITILGAAPFSDKAIQQIVARQPDAVVLDGQAAEEDYLPFTQKLVAATPSTKCVLFGNSVDVAVMARAVAAGVQGYLPTTITYPDFIESVSSIVAGRSSKAESVFTRTALAMAIPASDGGAKPSSRKVTSAMKKTASQCLNFGLTVPETARYLGMTEGQVEQCVARRATVSSASGVITNRRLLYGVALAVGLLTMSRVSGMRASDTPKTEPVQGQVLYEDGSTLPAGICELTFHSKAAPAQGRMRLGRGVLDGQKGEIQRVCYDAKFPGLPPGEYKVTVRLPGQLPLPEYIAATEYGDLAKTPLVIDTAQERFVLKIKRPKELMERFDRDANGSLEAMERASVREALYEGVKSYGGGN
jgi:DNA-binding NarL/FixJ family response regulator